MDIAMDKVLEDKKPVDEALHRAELKVAGLDGRIEMLAEQIQKKKTPPGRKHVRRAKGLRIWKKYR
ncbi:hypothetical protein SFC43_13090 [Bacteroides sp. CR5/BHMF/2]|nr:hypothetical protein [Bacteroides sp. CR5/BHMF/2]